jgi:hypothetical protein
MMPPTAHAQVSYFPNFKLKIWFVRKENERERMRK